MKLKELRGITKIFEIEMNLDGMVLLKGLMTDDVNEAYGDYEVKDTYRATNERIGILLVSPTKLEKQYNEITRAMCKDFVVCARDAVMAYDAGRKEDIMESVAQMSLLHGYCIGTKVSNIVSEHWR